MQHWRISQHWRHRRWTLYLRVSLTRVTALAPGCESVRLLRPGPGPHHQVARAAVRGGSQHPHGARPKYEYFLLGRETWQPRLWWLLVAHQPRILLRLQHASWL